MLSWSAVIDNGKSKLGRLHWVLRQLLVGDGSGVIPGEGAEHSRQPCFIQLDPVD